MRRALPMLASLSFVLAACTGAGDNAADTAGDTAATRGPGASAAGGATAGLVRDTTRATAAMRNAAGLEIGTITLTETAQGIAVAGELRGLPPGSHGIHLHMIGQCSPPFESAGGHWNPTNRQHGTQNPEGPHLGDIPNITVGADSTVNVQTTTAGGTLRGTNGALDADGVAVVVHAAADDNRTDPAGASGARIACGVVSGS